MTRKLGFFTIDVEEYYHIIDVRGTPQVEDWDRLPSRVEYGMDKLELLLNRCSFQRLGDYYQENKDDI